jgi:hypothetical protein
MEISYKKTTNSNLLPHQFKKIDKTNENKTQRKQKVNNQKQQNSIYNKEEIKKKHTKNTS